VGTPRWATCRDAIGGEDDDANEDRDASEDEVEMTTSPKRDPERGFLVRQSRASGSPARRSPGCCDSVRTPGREISTIESLAESA